MNIARFSLREILDPVATAAFFEQHWEAQPLLVERGRPDYFESVLQLTDIDRIISTVSLRYPQISMVNATQSIDSAQYTVGSSEIDRLRLYQQFADGSTIVLAQMQDYMPNLASLCRVLEYEFSMPFQTNVYLTPANAQGFKPHHDTHDVFVLQVAGSKRWRIYQSPLVLPLRGQEHDPAKPSAAVVEREFDLHAGDTVYIPRGIVHEASTSRELSLHITVGALSSSWADLLLEAVAETSLRDPAFRRSLPIGFARVDFDRAQARGLFRGLLDRLSATADFDATLDSFVDQLLLGCPPHLEGQMEQIDRLGALSIDSLVGARADLIYRIRPDKDGVRLGFGSSEIKVPVHAGPALQYALEKPQFVVRDLPGRDLDDSGKLVLVRRLVREGLLKVLRSETA